MAEYSEKSASHRHSGASAPGTWKRPKEPSSSGPAESARSPLPWAVITVTASPELSGGGRDTTHSGAMKNPFAQEGSPSGRSIRTMASRTASRTGSSRTRGIGTIGGLEGPLTTLLRAPPSKRRTTAAGTSAKAGGRALAATVSVCRMVRVSVWVRRAKA